MSKKSEIAAKLQQKIHPRWATAHPMKDASLLEQGMLAVLVRHMSQEKAESAIVALREGFADWNEMRVAQAQEIAGLMTRKGRKPSRHSIRNTIAAARDAREYLQEVFQRVHGLDLEILREDPTAGGKLLQQLPKLGLAGGSQLLWLANGGQLPVHGGLVRVLDRLGLVSRTGSVKKSGEAIAPLVPEEGKALEFAVRFSEIADRWCDARKPICQECVLVEDCPHGKKRRARVEGPAGASHGRRALARGGAPGLGREEGGRAPRSRGRPRREEGRGGARSASSASRRSRERADGSEEGRRREGKKKKVLADKKREADAKAQAAKTAKAKAAAEEEAQGRRRRRSAKGGGALENGHGSDAEDRPGVGITAPPGAARRSRARVRRRAGRRRREPAARDRSGGGAVWLAERRRWRGSRGSGGRSTRSCSPPTRSSRSTIGSRMRFLGKPSGRGGSPRDAPRPLELAPPRSSRASPCCARRDGASRAASSAPG